MKTTGENTCSNCKQKYPWLCHTADKLSGSKLPEAVSYEKGIGYVKLINGKYVGHCPHCDAINEFECYND